MVSAASTKDYEEFAYAVRNATNPAYLLLLLVRSHAILQGLTVDRFRWAAAEDEIYQRLDRMFDNLRPLKPKALANIVEDLRRVSTKIEDLKPRFVLEYTRWKNIIQ